MPTQISSFLLQALAFAGSIKYILIFIITIFEGPIIMVACGFFLRLGLLTLLPLFVALFLGDLVGDIMWYYIGCYFAEPFMKRYGKFFGVTPEALEKGKKLFFKYHSRILFISKVTMGLGLQIPILIVAGATKVSIKKYLFLNSVGEIVFVSILLVAGYFFGTLYDSIDKSFQWLFVIGLIVFVVAVIYGVSRYLKQRALELE